MISLGNLTLQNWNPFSIYPEIIQKKDYEWEERMCPIKLTLANTFKRIYHSFINVEQ